MERSTVQTLLMDLAESPAPPSNVDIARAAAAGRHTVRVRRMIAGGWTGLALAVVVVVVGVMSSGGGGYTSPTPVGPASPTAAQPDRSMPERAPESFDPMVRYAEFGWLPDGVTDLGFSTASDSFTLQAVMIPKQVKEGEAAPSVRVVIVAAGHGVDPLNGNDPAVPVASMPAGLEAEPVNGRPAHWVGTDDGGLSLRWEYAPGAWAAALVSNVDDMKGVARRVATEIRFGANTSVLLPYRTTAIPASLSIRSVRVSRNTNGVQWSVRVEYGTERTQYGDWPLTIEAYTSTAETSVIGNPTTTVDGYPAHTSTLPDGGSGLQMFNVKGVYLDMLTHSAETSAQLPGGLVGLFRSMEIYADPAQWH